MRGAKCFQKAFELDPREADAARRLAEGFAEDREWDLVEVVARRTIEGEGGVSAGLGDSKSSAAARYLPTNSWAWKALGVVELVRHRPTESFRRLISLAAEPSKLPPGHPSLPNCLAGRARGPPVVGTAG